MNEIHKTRCDARSAHANFEEAVGELHEEYKKKLEYFYDAVAPTDDEAKEVEFDSADDLYDALTDTYDADRVTPALQALNKIVDNRETEQSAAQSA